MTIIQPQMKKNHNILSNKKNNNISSNKDKMLE